MSRTIEAQSALIRRLFNDIYKKVDDRSFAHKIRNWYTRTTAREKGVLLSVAGDKVVRFAPPYVIERKHIDEAVAIVRGVLAEGTGK